MIISTNNGPRGRRIVRVDKITWAFSYARDCDRPTLTAYHEGTDGIKYTINLGGADAATSNNQRRGDTILSIRRSIRSRLAWWRLMLRPMPLAGQGFWRCLAVHLHFANPRTALE